MSSTLLSSAASSQAYLVPARKLDYVWEDVEPLIEEASIASRDKWFADDAYDRLRKAKAQLWVVWQEGTIIAVAITELIPHERRQVCKVVTCAGWNIRKWLKHLAEVEVWAKTQGCDHMEFNAHPTIAKRLKRQGYDVTHWCLEKDL